MHQHHAQHRHHCEGHIGAHERRFKPAFAFGSQVGAHNGANQTTGHDPRHGLFAERNFSKLCGRKSIELTIGAVIAGNQGGRRQQCKVLGIGGIGAQHRRQQTHQQTQLKRHTSPPLGLRLGHQPCRQGAAHHIAHDRQGGHPPHRCQAQADQPIDGDEGDVVGEKQTLAQGQQKEIGVHTPECI